MEGSWDDPNVAFLTEHNIDMDQFQGRRLSNYFAGLLVLGARLEVRAGIEPTYKDLQSSA